MQLAQDAAVAAKLPVAEVISYQEYDILSAVGLGVMRAEARKRECPRLRVINASYGYHKVEGHSGNYIVCAHGKGGRCDCQAAVLKAASPATNKAMQTKADRKVIRDQYQAPAVRALSTALTVLSPGVLRLLLATSNYHTEQKLDASASVATIADALAGQLVREEIKSAVEYGSDVAKAKGNLEAMLTKAGLAVPWAAPPPANSSDEEAADAVRRHLTNARGFSGMGMALWYMNEARTALRLVVDRAVVATLQAEIDLTALGVTGYVAENQAAEIEHAALVAHEEAHPNAVYVD
jgi:hypothetical protein